MDPARKEEHSKKLQEVATHEKALMEAVKKGDEAAKKAAYDARKKAKEELRAMHP